MQIDVVINLRARMLRQRPTLIDELSALTRRRALVHVTQTPAELAEVARELARRGTDLVLLAGGDGSLMAGVSALHEAFQGELPTISPIPAGTAGTIARNWGIAGSPQRCLDRILSGTRRRVPHPSLRVVGHRASAAEARIGFIVGTGLVARFFRLYYDRGAPGYRGSAWLVARIFAESFVGGPLAREVLEPLPCELVVDGAAEPPRAWSLVCCSVVRDLGIHMLVNHRAGEDPRRPHLVATPMVPRELGPRAPRVLTGRPIGGPGHVDRLVERFAVRFPTGFEGPYVLDGELLSAHDIVVTAGPLVPLALPA